MSMNLCFDVEGGGVVNFPFQSHTNLTIKILKAETTEKRLSIIEDYLISCKWEKEHINKTIAYLRVCFSNPNLMLSTI